MSQDTGAFNNNDKFLLGLMSNEELCSFLPALQKDTNISRELYNESCFEAAFYSQQWLERDTITEDISKPFSIDEQVTSAGCREKHEEGREKDLMLTNDTWQRIINNAFAASQKRVKPLFLMSYLYKDVKVVSAVISLLIIASVAFYGALKRPFDKKYLQNKTEIAGGSLDKQQAGKVSPGEGSAVNKEQQPVSTFDPIKEVRAAGKAPQKFILPSSDKSVVYLSEGSGFFTEHNAGIAVMVNTDSVVTISMKSGSAVFHVKKGAHKRFTVITPHFEARVTGTVFEVSVTGQKSTITVLEGEVVVTTIQGTQEVLTLTRGIAAYISQDSLIKDILQNSNMLKQRNNLLKSYLQYMHKSSLQQFSVDDVYDTVALKEKLATDSMLTLSDPIINARLMHYKAAHNSEKEHRYEKAEKHFLRIFEEDGDDMVGQLALLHLCILSTHNFSYEKSCFYCEKYIDTYSGGYARKEVMVLYIRNTLAENDVQRALPCMTRFVDQFPASSFADDIAFNAAQMARQQLLDMSKAVTYYEFVAENYPNSHYAEDALYWAGWCVVQQQVYKNDNKFIRQYRENYPDGTWRNAISEK